MNDENARRLAARIARDCPPQLITEDEVKAYRRVHYPHHFDRPDSPPPIPGDDYVAKLSHERFHEWFGTVCDGTCPHAKHAPPVACVRRSWWRRLFGGRS